MKKILADYPNLQQQRQRLLQQLNTLVFISRSERVLGETGIRILMRLMGLLLSAVAVQFILNGISDIWPGAAGTHH